MTIKPSDIAAKIVLPAGITPLNDASEFPSHYSTFGFGGMRSVASTAERDAIPAMRRVDGMVVYIVGDAYYRLNGGITNNDWEVFNTGSGGAQFKDVGFTASNWAVNTNDSDQVILTLTHNLNTTRFEVQFFRGSGTMTPVNVSWMTLNTTQVLLCINAPLSNAFAGLARFLVSGSGSNPTPGTSTSCVDGGDFTALTEASIPFTFNGGEF